MLQTQCRSLKGGMVRRCHDVPVIYSLEALHRKQRSGVSGTEMLAYVPDFVIHEAYGALLDALQSLPPRERSIIEGRFGVSGEGRLTLRQIGALWGLSDERISQIVEIVLMKLRQHMAKQYGMKHALLLQLEIPDGMSIDHCSVATFQTELWSLLTPDAEMSADPQR
jgi:hypothetical protein